MQRSPRLRRACKSEFNGAGSLIRVVSHEESPNMNSKQLANVLLKMLGLWICVQAIPNFISGFIRGFIAGLHQEAVSRSPASSWPSVAGWLVYLAVGIFLICRSRYLAQEMFKDEP